MSGDNWKARQQSQFGFATKRKSGGGGGGGPVLPQVASATLLLNLQADALVLNNGDPVSLWPDASGLGNDFSQTGAARPTFHTDAKGNYVDFDGIQNWLSSNFLTDPSSFSLFHVSRVIAQNDATGLVLAKGSFGDINNGGEFEVDDTVAGGGYGQLDTSGTPDLSWSLDTINSIPCASDYSIRNLNVTNKFDFSTYQERLNDSPSIPLFGHVNAGSTASTLPWAIGQNSGHDSNWAKMRLKGLLLYTPAVSNADRTSVLAWLKAKYTVHYFDSPLLSLATTANGTPRVVVIFQSNASSANPITGVTITLNGNPVTLSAQGSVSAKMEVDYDISSVGSISGTDVLTFAYDANVGDLNDGVNPLPSIPATPIINANVAS